MKKLLGLVILCFMFNLVGCVDSEVSKDVVQQKKQDAKAKESENKVKLKKYEGSWVDIRQKDEPNKVYMGLMITNIRENMASVQLEYPSSDGVLHQVKVGTVTFIDDIGRFHFDDDDFGNQGTVEIHLDDYGVMLVVNLVKDGGKAEGLQNARYGFEKLTISTDDATLKQ